MRTFNLLSHLRSHAVTLVTQADDTITTEDIENLRQYVNELIIFPIPGQKLNQPHTFNWMEQITLLANVLLKAKPPSAFRLYSSEMQSLIDTYVTSGKFDVVTCEHGINEVYIRPEFRKSVKVVLNAHSSRYGWTQSLIQSGVSSQTLLYRLYLHGVLRRYETNYSAKFSSIVVTTEDDRQQFLRFQPEATISVVPNGVNLQLYPLRTNDPGGQRLVFIGAMDALHNIDAARFLALAVMPLLRQRYADVTFTIVGARPSPEVLALQGQPGVTVTGQVPSMAEYLHQATVCVVPLRAGYGIKNKTLEAMAAGIPVVASDRGLEGLSVDQSGEPLRALRANTVEEYVNAISRLFEDKELRQQLSQNGRQLVESTYTWEQAGRAYEKALL